MFKTHQKRIVSWIAIFAILLTSFAPIVSHAINLSNSNLQEICTSEGMKLIPSGDAPAKHDSSMTMHDCSYCSLTSNEQYISSNNIQFGSMTVSSYSRFFIEYTSPVLQTYFQASHPPQAPPALI